jgi:hypothetical protein
MTTHDNTEMVLRHIEDTFNNKGGSEAADRYWSDPVLNFGAELPCDERLTKTAGRCVDAAHSGAGSAVKATRRVVNPTSSFSSSSK